MEAISGFVYALISVHSSIGLASDDVDRCEGVQAKSDYMFHVLDTDKVQKLIEFCQIYYGIKAREPDYINKALNPMIERSNGLSFLKDIDFKVKTFDSKGEGSGLGFSYHYNKTQPLADYSYNANHNFTTGISWNFSAKGNVAFDSAINPADFLDSRISVAGFRDYGGISKVATESTIELLDNLDDEAVDLEGRDLVVNREKFKKIVNDFFSTQTYMHYDLNVGLESNQAFTDQQWAYGAKFALDIKSYEKNSTLALWNIADYPFALVRMFTGYGNSQAFIPLGSTFPTFVVGFDQVDPVKNSLRESLGEKEKFDRAKAEVYFRTPIGYINKKELFANIDYRYWQEMSPSMAIKSAGIDKFSYATLSISSSNGVYLSYAHGKLPFDMQSSKLYELGWKFHFD